MYRLGLLGLIVSLSACSEDAASYATITGPKNLALSEVVGTSLHDMWAVVPTGIASATELQHYDGTTWSPIEVRLGGMLVLPTKLADAGEGSVFVSGVQGQTGVIVRVDSGGGIVDQTTKFPAITAQQQTAIRGGRGGVFVRLASGETFSLGADGMFAPIASPPSAEAMPIYAPAIGDGYFVTSTVPTSMYHFHDGAWETLPFTNVSAFTGVGTSATDVWLPGGGVTGAHGDGQTWSEYTITGVPKDGSDTEYTELGLVSTGVGKVAVFGQRRVTDDGGDHVKAVLMHLDTKLRVTREESVFDGRCVSAEFSRCPGVEAGAFTQLEDGSLIFKSDLGDIVSGTTYFVGQPTD